MQLLRFALIALSSPPPGSVLSMKYRSTHGIEVHTTNAHATELSTEPTEISRLEGLKVAWPDPLGDPALIGVTAVVDGLEPLFDFDGQVIVPEKEREEAEASIEEYADLLSVAHQCRRSIRSPQLCVALVPESEGELRGANGLSTAGSTRPSSARYLPDLCADKVVDLIFDRMQGLRLLAGANSEESLGGRARDLYRLIEAAFGAPIGSLKKPLYEFLSAGPFAMRFTKKETDKWIEMRGKAMHGDVYPAPDSDLRPFLPRLEWSAYDLLLNKSVWGSRFSGRRLGMPIMAGPTKNGGLVVFHPAPTVSLEWFDVFGKYALDRRSVITLAGDGVVHNMSRLEHDE